MVNVEAVIVRVRDLGEADKIVTMFSREEGKLAAVARGARRPRNRLSAATQLFTHGDMALFPGRGLGSLSQIEIRQSFRRLREDLVRMAYATYVAELVDEFMHEKDRQESVFLLLLVCLHLLAEPETDPEPVLRSFQLKLLSLLGFRPVLTECVQCAAPVQGTEVIFSASAGGVLCASCRPGAGEVLRVSRGALEALRVLLAGDIRRAHVLRLTPEMAAEVARVSEAFIATRVEKRLRSLQFLDEVRGSTPL